jgi:asparagine synthase (glutamine-hydrolysing)
MDAGLVRHLDWSRIFTADEIDSLAQEPLPTEREALDRDADAERRWNETARRDPINARLEADRDLFLPGDLLPKVDRMSMAHSLEVRVPYLDEDLAEFVIGLPGPQKVGTREGKLLLRRVASRLLPQRIAARRKQGFDVPIGAWLRGPLREALTDYLSDEATRRRGLFRPGQVGALVREHLDGTAQHGDALWTLLALEGWQQRVLDRAARVPA